MELGEIVCRGLVGLLNFVFWWDSETGRFVWKAACLVVIFAFPTTFFALASNGIVLSRRGLIPTIHRTMKSKVQDVVVDRTLRSVTSGSAVGSN